MRLLFVSEYDTCRAPFARGVAEAVMRTMNVPGIDTDTAGIAVVDSERVPNEIVNFARMQDVDLAAHRSKPLTPRLLEWCDAALCMTRRIAEDIRRSSSAELGGKAVLFARAADLDQQYEDFDPVHSTVGGWNALASALRAASGKLVRRVDAEYLTAAKLGVGLPLEPKGIVPPPRLSPAAQIVFSVLRDASGPMPAQAIAEAASRLGERMDRLRVAMLFQGELKRHVVSSADGGWELLAARKDREDGSRRASTRSTHSGAGPSPEVDPAQVRAFVRRFALEFLRRAFEPVTTADLLAGMRAAGHPVTSDLLTDVLRTELRDLVDFTDRGHWVAKEDSATSRGPRDSFRNRAGSTTAGSPPPPPPPPNTSQKLHKIQTMREALDLLGIAGEPGDVDEVKKIHRTLIMKYHPDRFADDEEFRSMAEEKARRINMAWDFVRKRLENE